MDYEIYDLGKTDLQDGGTLANAQIAFQTHGKLNDEKANVVLFPTWYSSQHTQNEWFIGPTKALDPRRWFIVVPNLLGNGLSSSPSNTPPPFDRMRFPAVSIYDNAMLQRRFLHERFGIERIALVIGRSMGALVAFQWGCLFPDIVDRIFPFSGAARTSPHNYVFLAGLHAALTADAGWQGGEYNSPPFVGLRAFGRVYAGWIYSQSWYRQHFSQNQPSLALERFLSEQWDQHFLKRDANDLISQLLTWQRADISDNPVFKGDFELALSAIRARAIVLTSSTDLYFTPADNEYAVARMPDAELRIVPSSWGHRTAGPSSDPRDSAILDGAIKDLLSA